MKIVEDAPQGVKPIDYNEIVEAFNRLEPNGDKAIKIARVYNITLFKEILGRRGGKSDVDFQAYSSGDHTYIKRLTQVEMTKD